MILVVTIVKANLNLVSFREWPVGWVEFGYYFVLGTLIAHLFTKTNTHVTKLTDPHNDNAIYYPEFANVIRPHG